MGAVQCARRSHLYIVFTHFYLYAQSLHCKQHSQDLTASPVDPFTILSERVTNQISFRISELLGTCDCCAHFQNKKRKEKSPLLTMTCMPLTLWSLLVCWLLAAETDLEVWPHVILHTKVEGQGDKKPLFLMAARRVNELNQSLHHVWILFYFFLFYDSVNNFIIRYTCLFRGTLSRTFMNTRADFVHILSSCLASIRMFW